MRDSFYFNFLLQFNRHNPVQSCSISLRVIKNVRRKPKNLFKGKNGIVFSTMPFKIKNIINYTAEIVFFKTPYKTNTTPSTTIGFCNSFFGGIRLSLYLCHGRFRLCMRFHLSAISFFLSSCLIFFLDL